MRDRIDRAELSSTHSFTHLHSKHTKAHKHKLNIYIPRTFTHSRHTIEGTEKKRKTKPCDCIYKRSVMVVVVGGVTSSLMYHREDDRVQYGIYLGDTTKKSIKTPFF